MRRVASLSLVAVFGLTTTAIAQSKRYPPEPVDKDREAAEKSKLWDHATNPKARPYEDLVDEARRAIGDRTEARYRDAVDKLGQAIAMAPAEVIAYELRGATHMELSDWVRCADDLAVAAASGPRDPLHDRKAAIELRRKLGICQARAGKLGDAERTLSEAASSGTGTGEMLMRLGEVRIAMGKLDEAIGALTAALDAPDLPSAAITRWLLASAYDRARRPAEANAEAQRAALADRSFSALVDQKVPLLGAGEAEYLLGLAWSSSEPPWPETALVYFRQFIKLAPDSPWRRRADDHLRELRAATLPETVDRTGGLAAVDLDAARGLVRKAMPAMRACMAKLPGTVIEVTVTKAGPRSPLGTVPVKKVYPHRRYKYRPPAPPPPGVTVALSRNVEPVPRADTDAAARCIDPLAARIAMPAVKEQDAWYKIRFVVVSP